MDPASDLIGLCYSNIHFTLHCNAHCNINEDRVILEIILTITGGSVMEVKMLSDVLLENKHTYRICFPVILKRHLLNGVSLLQRIKIIKTKSLSDNRSFL